MASDVPVGPPVVPPLDRRAADLRRLADEPWDLLIVGGGIVGVGALLDAASRGLRVALVEQDDIASGTSSRSSRLIHGGLRYLQQFHVGLVREALDERARLLRLAPHLVRLEEFLFPLYGLPIVTRAFYGTGMTMYDVLGSAKSGGRHRQLSTASTLEYAPNLRRKGLRGGLVYHDGMEDDARFAARGRPDRRRARGRGGDRGDPGAGDGARSAMATGSRAPCSRTWCPVRPSTRVPPRCSMRRASGGRCPTGRSAPDRSASCHRWAATSSCRASASRLVAA